MQYTELSCFVAVYTAIQSDCRMGNTSRNKMASFKKIKFGDSEISLSCEDEDLSNFVEVLVSIMCIPLALSSGLLKARVGGD